MPPAATVAVPDAGGVTAVTVRASPVSGAIVSLARTLKVVAPESSATVNVSSTASGSSLTGVIVTAICQEADIPAMEEILFRETTTLGIRRNALCMPTLALI